MFITNDAKIKSLESLSLLVNAAVCGILWQPNLQQMFYATNTQASLERWTPSVQSIAGNTYL